MSAQLVQFARKLWASNAVPCAHHAEAATALAHSHLLSDCDRWFCSAVLRVPALSERNLAHLHEIAAKVERGRG